LQGGWRDCDTSGKTFSVEAWDKECAWEDGIEFAGTLFDEVAWSCVVVDDEEKILRVFMKFFVGKSFRMKTWRGVWKSFKKNVNDVLRELLKH
jgi:hypothetical protein